MAQFDPNSPPVRPGFYSIVRATAAEAVAAGAGSVVCIPMLRGWGPEGVATKVASPSDFDLKFGSTKDDSRLAVLGAFTGDGSPSSGASEVWIYRLPITGAAKAAVTLQNTAPAAAITLTAKYKGLFANGLNVTTRAHPTDAGQRQLLIYNGAELLEVWTYATTNITDLAAQINHPTAGSRYVAASGVTTGTALGPVSNVALTGGLDGSATAPDWTAALALVEGIPFNIITMPNMVDTTVLAAARTWLDNLNRQTRRAMLVTGGANGEGITDAITRSALSSNQPDIVNAGYNVFIDAADGAEKSTAQMVGYFAGLIAGAGVRESVTFSRITGYSLKVRPSHDTVVAAINGGVLISTQDDEGVRIEKQVTTFTNKADVVRPYAVYSKILSVRILHRIDTDLTALTNAFWIGKVKNNTNSRAGYLGVLEDYFKSLEDDDVLTPGASSIDFDPNSDSTGDTWYPTYRVTLQQAVERVLAIGVVS